MLAYVIIATAEGRHGVRQQADPCTGTNRADPAGGRNMTKKLMAGVALGCALALSGVAVAESEQGYSIPRTAWGAPDLQGFWNNTSITSLQRPGGVDKLVL